MDTARKKAYRILRGNLAVQYSNEDSQLIDPQSIWYLCWMQVVMMCTLIVLIEIPLAIFLESYLNPSVAYLVFRLCTIIILIIDMWLQFYTQSYENGHMITKQSKVVMQYLQNQFIYDCIPLITLMLTTLQTANWIQLLFLLKLKFLFYYDDVMQETLQFYRRCYITYSLLKVMLIMLYLFHLFGCLFYAVGAKDLDLGKPSWIDFSGSWLGIIVDYPWATQYTIATYWALETMVTAGYGEITALDDGQILVADIVLIGSVCLVLYVVSSISALQGADYRADLVVILKFMKAKQVSQQTINDITIYIQQFYYDRSKRDVDIEQSVMNCLPMRLRKHLMYESYKQQLNSVLWIQLNLSLEVKQDIALTIIEHIYHHDYTVPIVDCQGIPSLFIIVKGNVELSYNGVQYLTLHEGQAFGEFEFITGQSSKYQVICQGFTQLLTIRLDQFMLAISRYPKDLFRFNQIKHEMIFNQQYSLIGLKCIICLTPFHRLEQCSKLQFQGKPQITIDQIQDRQLFRRRLQKHKLIYCGIINKQFDLQLQYTNLNIDSKDNTYTDDLVGYDITYQLQTTCDQCLMLQIINDNATINQCIKHQNVPQLHKYQYPTILPSNQLLIYWKILIQSISVILFIEVPLIFFFGDDFEDFSQFRFEYMRTITMIILSIDIIIEFHVAYYHHGELIRLIQNTAHNYLTTNFLFDFIPLLVLIYYTFDDSNYWIHLLIFLKLVPFYQTEQRFHDKMCTQSKLLMLYLMFRLFVEILYLNHFFGCLFYRAGAYVYQNRPDLVTWLNEPSCNFGIIMYYGWFKKYILATYWAFNALTTVGYGDIVPLNVYEIAVCNLAMIAAVMVVAINISNILNMNASLGESQFQKEDYAIRLFMHNKGCSQELQMQVKNFLGSLYKECEERDIHLEQEVFKKLPESLLTLMLYESYKKYLHTGWISIFDEFIVKQLCGKVEEKYYCPDEVLFLDNKICVDNCLYFIGRGTVELFINVQQSSRDIVKLAKLHEGTKFGDFGFITGLDRKASARSVDYSQLLCITRVMFIGILKQNQAQYIKFMKLREQIEFNDPQLDLLGIQCYTCNSNYHMSIDCPLNHYIPDSSTMIMQLNTSQINNRYYQQRTRMKQQPIIIQSKLQMKLPILHIPTNMNID